MKPDNAGTGLVIGQFGLGVVDSADPDMEPEVIPLAGTVTFTPNVPYLPNPTAEPNPITIVTSAITAVLDSEGYVCTPGPDGITPFYRGIRLFATDDPDLSVENWTWSVVYTFQPVNGIVPKIPAHSMSLLEGETIDLATVVPVPSSPGIGTPQALALLQQAVEAAATSAGDAAKALAAAERAEQVAGATDTGVALLLDDPETFTGALLDDKLAPKADTASVTQALGEKANATDLELKADKYAVEAELITKADATALETKADLVSGKVPEGQIPTRLSAGALTAAIGDTVTGVNDIHRAIETMNMPIMQNTRSELARLRNKDARPARVVRLVTGNTDQTPAAFGGMTAVHVANQEGRSAWKVATTSGIVNRLDVPLDLHPGPVNAVTAWVYVTDPTITTRVQIVATGPAGSWIQYHDASRTNLTGKPLVKGWNFIRMDAAGLTSYARLQDVTNVSVRFTVSGVTTNYVGPVDLEVREKATILIVNDWGSKAFYDAAYPDMKARGWPVIWAPRTERFGEATYPDNMTTLDEVKTIMSENNNEVSYHSPDGSATSGLTPAQARENVLKALVGLKVHGVYSDGALWRAAWVQNVAPGAAATRDLMVASATPNDRYHTTPWPALDRYDIPRYGIHGGGTDAILEILRQTRQVCVFYTHALTPAGSSNHASQAQWDTFVAAVDAGVAAGWLEVLNMGQTLERYPLIRTGNEVVTLVDATAPLTPPEPEPEVPPIVTTLVTGLNDTTPTVFAGLTTTHVADVDGRPAWKIDSTDTGACRLDVPVTPAKTAPNPQTVVFNVHVANPAPFTQITINIRGTAGTWTRTTDQSLISGWPLVAGWNEIRIAATAAPLANLADVASVNVAFVKTGPQVLHVGAVTIESPGS